MVGKQDQGSRGGAGVGDGGRVPSSATPSTTPESLLAKCRCVRAAALTDAALRRPGWPIPLRPVDARSVPVPALFRWLLPLLNELADDADASPSAQLLYPRDEVPVGNHIIAFRFHHHHEIALPFDVEQHFSLALAIQKQRVQPVNRSLASGFQRHANSNRPLQGYFRI